MADTTSASGTDGTAHADADTHAGKKFMDDATAYTQQANKAPADQTGYDPTDAKWDDFPGGAARANGYPRS